MILSPWSYLLAAFPFHWDDVWSAQSKLHPRWAIASLRLPLHLHTRSYLTLRYLMLHYTYRIDPILRSAILCYTTSSCHPTYQPSFFKYNKRPVLTASKTVLPFKPHCSMSLKGWLFVPIFNQSWRFFPTVANSYSWLHVLGLSFEIIIAAFQEINCLKVMIVCRYGKVFSGKIWTSGNTILGQAILGDGQKIRKIMRRALEMQKIQIFGGRWPIWFIKIIIIILIVVIIISSIIIINNHDLNHDNHLRFRKWMRCMRRN